MQEWKAQTFIGTKLQQAWHDLWLWESFFNNNPLAVFIELGTGVGGSSLFFSLQCYQRGIQFHTFDNQRFFDFETALPAGMGMKHRFHHIDLFSEEAKTEVAQIITSAPGPAAIFFDNGDKAREWGIFGPLTRPGDFCAVHDWGKEFLPKDIGELPVEMLQTEPPGEMTRWFKRI